MTPWQWVEGAIGIVLILAIVGGAVAFFGTAIWFIIWGTYKQMRYERHGVCSKCKKPYVETLVKSAGQLYGPSTITQGVCPNGHVGIPSGNRRFADW